MTLVHSEQAPNDYAAAFSDIIRERRTASLVGNDAHQWKYRQRIVEFARQSRLPALGYSREFAEAGALLSYGAIGAADQVRACDQPQDRQGPRRDDPADAVTAGGSRGRLSAVPGAPR